MKWPWTREDPEPEPRGLKDAREARETAEDRLREVREQASEVARIADSLRRIRRRNHLVEILEESIRNREEGRDHA